MTTTTTLPDLYGPAYGAPVPPVPTVLGGMLTTAGVRKGHSLHEVPGTWHREYLPGAGDDENGEPYVLASFRAWTYCGRANVAGTARLSWDGMDWSAECPECGRSFTHRDEVKP